MRVLFISRFLIVFETFPPYTTSYTLYLVNSTNYLPVPVHTSPIPDSSRPSTRRRCPRPGSLISRCTYKGRNVILRSHVRRDSLNIVSGCRSSRTKGFRVPAALPTVRRCPVDYVYVTPSKRAGSKKMRRKCAKTP